MQQKKKVPWMLQTTPQNNKLFVSMHVCMCRASRLGIDGPSGIVVVCSVSSMARFMLMGVCWNLVSIIQPSCIENKTKGPAADISMGSLSLSLLHSLYSSPSVSPCPCALVPQACHMPTGLLCLPLLLC